jgi:hypothetical protein
MLRRAAADSAAVSTSVARVFSAGSCFGVQP